MKRVTPRRIEMNRNAVAMEARVEFARMLNNALVEGQTPRGPVSKWTNNGFADRIYELDPKDPPYTEASVRGWRNVEKPGNPDRNVIGIILDALYGDHPTLAETRAKMFALWKRANGQIEPEDIVIDRDTANIGHWTDDLARLSTHVEPARDRRGQPVCGVHSECRIFVTDPIAVEVDGRQREVTVGITRASLRIGSDTHEFVEGTLAGSGERGNENLEPRASGFRVKGPLEPACGRINGLPLNDSLLVSLRRYRPGPPVARVALETDRGAFKVVFDDSNETVDDANRVAVLNALMAAKFETDAAALTLKQRVLDLPDEPA
jgi:hypothetical protein